MCASISVSSWKMDMCEWYSSQACGRSICICLCERSRVPIGYVRMLQFPNLWSYDHVEVRCGCLCPCLCRVESWVYANGTVRKLVYGGEWYRSHNGRGGNPDGVYVGEYRSSWTLVCANGAIRKSICLCYNCALMPDLKLGFPLLASTYDIPTVTSTSLLVTAAGSTNFHHLRTNSPETRWP